MLPIILLAGIGLFFVHQSSLLQAQQTTRPNILLILTDDQRFDSMDFMPKTKERIFDQGVSFTKAYATTPLCCPSRVSILTGMYARHHGVRINDDQLTISTFVKSLNDAGYYTGMIGKYLNSHDGTPLPEYDYWVHGVNSYIDPKLNVNGVEKKQTGYITYIMRDYAQKFLTNAHTQPAPFLLLFWTKAPHEPAIPAPGDETLYPTLAPYRPPSHNSADVSDKPLWVKRLPLLTSAKIKEHDAFRKKQLQSLKAVDRSIDSLLTTLASQGKLDKTLIIFLSDNGFLHTEHRLKGKKLPYEESVKVPFAIRYPPLIPTPRVESQLVANIDIAPTIYQLAGLPIPTSVDGRSLVPLLQGTTTWRDALLLEGWDERTTFSAVHDTRWVYIETPGDIPELYDLQKDPYQLQNQAQNPAYQETVTQLRDRLHSFP
jgi:N-acetylglucosamine-6-sulfatase